MPQSGPRCMTPNRERSSVIVRPHLQPEDSYVPNRYPQEAALRDGRRVLLRPFASGDSQALFEFFQRLPEAYRRFAWDPIENRLLIESWGQNIDYSKTFPL